MRNAADDDVVHDTKEYIASDEITLDEFEGMFLESLSNIDCTNLRLNAEHFEFHYYLLM